MTDLSYPDPLVLNAEPRQGPRDSEMGSESGYESLLESVRQRNHLRPFSDLEDSASSWDMLSTSANDADTSDNAGGSPAIGPDFSLPSSTRTSDEHRPASSSIASARSSDASSRLGMNGMTSSQERLAIAASHPTLASIYTGSDSIDSAESRQSPKRQIPQTVPTRDQYVDLASLIEHEDALRMSQVSLPDSLFLNTRILQPDSPRQSGTEHATNESESTRLQEAQQSHTHHTTDMPPIKLASRPDVQTIIKASIALVTLCSLIRPINFNTQLAAHLPNVVEPTLSNPQPVASTSLHPQSMLEPHHEVLLPEIERSVPSANVSTLPEDEHLSPEVVYFVTAAVTIACTVHILLRLWSAFRRKPKLARKAIMRKKSPNRRVSFQLPAPCPLQDADAVSEASSSSSHARVKVELVQPRTVVDDDIIDVKTHNVYMMAKVGVTSLFHRQAYNTLDNVYEAEKVPCSMRFAKGGTAIELALHEVQRPRNGRLVIPAEANDPAAVLLLVFNLLEERTFEGVKRIYEKIQSRPPHSQPTMFLIGNKSDATHINQEWIDDIEHWAEKCRLPFFQVSARRNEGVTDCFRTISRQLRKRI